MKVEVFILGGQKLIRRERRDCGEARRNEEREKTENSEREQREDTEREKRERDKSD